MFALSSKFFILLFFIILFVSNGNSFLIPFRKRELTQCPGSYHITNLKFSPNPIPLHKSSFPATVSGTTDQEITGGSIVAEVYGYNNTYDICQGQVKCPIPVGPFSFSGNVNVPQEISTSCLALKVTGVKAVVRAYDSSGNVLGCIQGKVPISCS
ncbi:hypothetical protein F8M41_016121 [Gigaspora margarita]|uniref:Phosphatidylglycerol/phosphatidylinositol transfer protein n=1 Tax=Gigaspora margarita TaxID=4874 RepID=A0A8H3WTW7_GIGMA|nr:hypothetical protein F8M41_016121 [Gigaspora margarita]